MSFRIEMNAQSLARSKFAISPILDVLGVIRSRGNHSAPHVRRWYHRGMSALDTDSRDLLHALVPHNHPRTPDFLHPYPQSPRETMGEIAARIAATPEHVVDYHLDIGYRGRTVHPNVAALFANRVAYETFRLPIPPSFVRVLDRGPAVVAQLAAAGLLAFFNAGMAGDWPRASAVLEADIAHRGEVMIGHGAETVLADLGEGFTWTGSEVVIECPFQGTADWASDGLLFVPSTSHSGPVVFAAERPLPPMVFYGARGTAQLSETQLDRRPIASLASLIGSTRAELLGYLQEPATTRALSLRCDRTEATISYHLTVLHDAGLLSRTRRGGRVLYALTPLAQALREPAASSARGTASA